MEGHKQAPASGATGKPNRRIFPYDASIVLVGCHGAGKRTLGFIAAKYLGRRLLTEEHCFEQSTGCSRATFLQKYGRDAFNSHTAVVLSQTLEMNRRNCIIECSAGTLSQETQSVLAAYAEANPVIYVHRDKEDLYRLLKLPVADAQRLLLADQKHREFSNLEYFNLLDTSGDGSVVEEAPLRSASAHSARLIKAKRDFIDFLDHLSGHGLTRSWLENPFSFKAIPPEYRDHSFVLCLRVSMLMNMNGNLGHLEASADAVELIIDTWPSNILDFLAFHVALIRRKLDLPIIFHVEEHPREERQRTLEERDAMDLELMMHGLRLGVDYLSLDLERSEDLVSHILSMRGRTKIIGNYLIKGLGAPQWTDDVYMQRYLRGQALGCQVVRIARFCAVDRADELRQAFLDKVESVPDPKPQIIAYDYSVFGVVSPFQSRLMNPIGHDSLDKSVREPLAGIHNTRGVLRLSFRKGLLQPLNFYTLGSNVYYSASPAMHRAAYEHYMMPHTFEAKSCDSMEDLDRIRLDPNFGGASMTTPFKVAAMSRVDHLSSHATAIGAVNTLLPLRGKTASILDHCNARNQSGATNKFYGDNTDWSSIVTCLRRAISPRNSVQPSRTTALVIGAGGMARAAVYALIKLGCRNIFIFNRTLSKADEVASHFNLYSREKRLLGRRSDEDRICHVIPSASEPWPQGFHQPTMILSCIPASGGTDESPPVDFRMPRHWLGSPTGGVVVELAYEPLITPLIVQMRNLREEGVTSWVTVDGLEVVSEMAMEAFELMTGRKAPRKLMRRACNETWEKQCAPFQPMR
ncbi:hypothetical protein F4780DRAFT_789908 [Xylariomycetidae sp. FL0641]|nr:hypothetical protein F4780DRAFT_789908 [Xylariomycetidae sp. FL0641]